MTQPPQWLQVAQATGAVATTIGVLIALYIAAVREPRKAAEERRHHIAQLDALHRAEKERIAAQARKVVPSCLRTPMFGDAWWAVRIDNASNAMTTILTVDVTALDANGMEVPCGCTQANNTMPVDQAFDRSIRAALSGSSGHLAPTAMHAIRDALAGHIVKEWPRTLPPNQHAVMAYTTTDPRYQLRITIYYEDEAGYVWRRTDASQPTRTARPMPSPSAQTEPNDRSPERVDARASGRQCADCVARAAHARAVWCWRVPRVGHRITRAAAPAIVDGTAP